jgi:flagellar assembly protein FliH
MIPLSDLPKEQQSAYQRWEMTSFGDERPSTVAARQAAARPEAPSPALAYPSVDELAAIGEQARREGHEEGLAAGHQEGLAAGRAEALALGQAEAAIELAHLRALAQQFGDAVAAADQLIAGEVLELALHLSRAMLGCALKARPELILPLVREAIDALPTLQLPAQLALHPDDARVVRASLGEELGKDGWRIVDDAHIGRGGCRIDTASNQIDAQAAVRWQRLTQGLGKDLEWLEP